MNVTIGLLIVGLAAILQGTFFLPMTYTKKWEWAHKWFAFSLLGMLVANWLIALSIFPNLGGIISQIPTDLLFTVLIFGLAWGAGAILFGKGMDMLGMALGYPIINGISATAGTIIPAIIFSPAVFLQSKGQILIVGALFTLLGIVFCGKASARKTSNGTSTKIKASGVGIIIAIIAGFTSCLPNIGAAFSTRITEIALQSGVDKVFAANVVWSLFFTMGAVVNAAYCLYLTNKNKNTKEFVNEYKVRNWLLILAMSVMWIGSFYLYGIGCSMLGDLGLIVGWPLLICLSIIIGNLWGIYRGEWKNANAGSRKLLNVGLLTLLVSIIITAMSNLF
jgi:L-rhamnose-H+ transport protein